MNPFLLGGKVGISDVVDVARRFRRVSLPGSAAARVRAANRALRRAAASGKPVYGVNTGFGELASRRIPPGESVRLQYNLVRSHACGVGEPLGPEESRAMLFLRANELARGYSGCRVELVAHLAGMLNRGLCPVVPSRGSVGASGDLAPQAHAALLAIGEGEGRLWDGAHRRWGVPMPGRAALRRAGLKGCRLDAKEGLSLINGTQAMQAVSALALDRARNVLAAANLAGAMSLEGIRGTPAPYDEALARLKPHPGQLWAAKDLRGLLAGSEIRESHREGDPRVQDPYSLRCIPQVHGAVKDALDFALRTLHIEMGGVTDNPVLIGTRVLSGGNFHGQALALSCDAACIALAALGNISERRTFQLILGHNGLPPFLALHPGLESGYMIAQVVAAALASENKGLAVPASADSIPTSADKEDFVSMGMGAALKLGRSADNAAQIVAIELLTAAQAVELHRPLRSGAGVERGLRRLRAEASRTLGDEAFGRRMLLIKEMVSEGRLREAA